MADCNKARGDLLCGLEKGHQGKHADGEAEWADSDPLPPRTKEHIKLMDGKCTRCRSIYCELDL